ncbi:MAG TPA: hypothetical protein VHG91_18085 [Longimicrobium sp.]|nr:hypothetical protein [Longimicrobium sp.]
MFTRCIFCHATFPENDTLEHFRRAGRVAFDPARGRLWALCGTCHRWSLAPIEERWEALDELEKVVTDRGRTLAQTDNIALVRAGDLEVVRVGKAQLVEEAWWRYGREFQQRRKRSYVIQAAEGVAWIAASVATGGAMVGMYGAGLSVNLARWWRFGSVAWKGSAACATCGAPLEELKFKETGKLMLRADGEGEVSFLRRCATCRAGYGKGPVITGAAAERLLRRSLAWRNFSGATEQQVREATAAIEQAGSAGRLTRYLAQDGVRLDKLQRHHASAVALEIAANEDTERRLLEMEVAALEARWKEEEEIAAIADRELSFLPASLDRLLRRTPST